MVSILVIDDDEMLCDMVCRRARYMDHNAAYALTLKDGVAKLQAGNFDLVFLDVRLPDGNGLDALPEIQELPSSPEIIIITGEGDADGAELAIKSGAWNYLHKPLSMLDLKLEIMRVLEYRREKVGREQPVSIDLGDMVGESPLMKACIERLTQAAGSDANVLITGETGTGKELFARAIHLNSSRASSSFVVVDCAALPDTLVESVLFGHVKGAFTGADKEQSGLVKQADGGTLFLDEIGELPSPVQKVFLRVLQERSFRPVGGEQEVKSDFRLVAATNRNLDEMVAAGQFRKDMLFRVRTLCIELPPLRERVEDIKYIALHHLDRLCGQRQTRSRGFSSDFFGALESHSWPGNVRELVNCLEGALSAAGEDSTLFARHLPTHMRVKMARDTAEKRSQTQTNATSAAAAPLSSLPAFREFRDSALDSAENQYLQELIAASAGNLKDACTISGLSKSRLYELLKKHDLSIS